MELQQIHKNSIHHHCNTIQIIQELSIQHGCYRFRYHSRYCFQKAYYHKIEIFIYHNKQHSVSNLMNFQNGCFNSQPLQMQKLVKLSKMLLLVLRLQLSLTQDSSCFNNKNLYWKNSQCNNKK